MLGIGRASEYAGWWNTSLKSVAFSSTSKLTPTIQRPTGYSFATYPTGGATWGASEVRNSPSGTAGTINLTGLTGYTGYNYLRSTNVVHFYPNTATWTLGSNNNYSTVRQQWTNSSSVTAGQQDISVGVDSSSNMTASFLNQVLTIGTLTSRLDKWVTIACATAETSSVFTSWTGGSSGGSNTLAVRVTAWDTLTGTFLAKADSWADPTTGGSQMPGNWATQYGTTITVQQTYTANTLVQYSYNYSTAQTPIGGIWIAWGTMFDPLSSTDTSWRTAAPNSQIGQAVALYQTQFTGYTTSTTTNAYNVNAVATSLYTQSDNIDWYGNFANTTIRNNMYSTSILVRNN